MEKSKQHQRFGSAARDEGPSASLASVDTLAPVGITAYLRAVTPLRRRAGLTLVEMVVVLVVLGLAATLAAPTIVQRQPTADAALRRVIDQARAAALRRAESVVLTIEETGRWSVRVERDINTPPLLTDSLTTPTHPIRVHVTPLGTCVAEGLVAFDALRCAPEAASSR
jgi:prepilin-type N-terminal cleavage/methylation domain-containing protein